MTLIFLLNNLNYCIVLSHITSISIILLNKQELIKAWVNLIQSLQQDYNPITREAIQASRFLVHFIIGFCLLEAKVLFIFY